jgi:transcriptional regulator with XRE-family HTH domain
MFDYTPIDLVRTGKKIRALMSKNAYSASYVQQMLHLSCPQPVYRWLSGKTLPSVDHLYNLSKLLNVHMEELLVAKSDESFEQISWCVIQTGNTDYLKRISKYLEMTFVEKR